MSRRTTSKKSPGRPKSPRRTTSKKSPGRPKSPRRTTSKKSPRRTTSKKSPRRTTSKKSPEKIKIIQKESYTYVKLLAFLYLVLAGWTIYCSVVLFQQYVDPANRSTSSQDDHKVSLANLDTPSVFYFSLSVIISITSIICFYLFFKNNIGDYKVLLFNCILGFTSLMLLAPMVLSYQYDDERIGDTNAPIYIIASASVGIFLSGIVITRALLTKNKS